MSTTKTRVDQGVKQRGAEKMARIPIKIAPAETILRKPEWIRVKAPTGQKVARLKINWLHIYMF